MHHNAAASVCRVEGKRGVHGKRAPLRGHNCVQRPLSRDFAAAPATSGARFGSRQRKQCPGGKRRPPLGRVMSVSDAQYSGRYFRSQNWLSEYGLSFETYGRVCVSVTPTSASKNATGLELSDVPCILKLHGPPHGWAGLCSAALIG
jgi:hypothetical protein